MKYISTRDSSHSRTAAQAILEGIAPDGGLYLPQEIPALSREMLEELCPLTYQERAARILGMFLTDYTKEELEQCVKGAYDEGFDEGRPAPLSTLSDGTALLELWHGPTCAFKDMALQLLPRLMTSAMAKEGDGRQVVILVVTSGDTGKAALEGFKDVPGTRIMVFYPQQGVSRMQKRQMTTQQGNNVSVMAIEGNFDDAQTGVKKIFGDRALQEELGEKGFVLSSANSINWGRLVPQIVYYISAYCDLAVDGRIKLGDQVNFCVPTGNFGNILAAHYARRMGLPVGMLVCASNENDVLTELMNTGVYNRNRPFHTTISPSMDILISSNLERLLYELSGCSDEIVRQLMESLSATGRYQLSENAMEQLRGGFWGGCCGEEETKATIRALFEEYSYLCDPHTAVAMNVARQYQRETEDNRPMVVVSTASPYKFADSVLSALGRVDIPEDDFEKAALLERLSGVSIPAPISALRDRPQRFDACCAPAEMPDAVKSFLLK
ncbi:threonine synthase [Angelakisella massiliensis]|uniref:threonine synthase n=1 Tax=Angelakisella massiliensis TaxID=1871018 RepID=UPI0023A7DCD3|nr:threonine synthase [Angelakisella massiliensis]